MKIEAAAGEEGGFFTPSGLAEAMGEAILDSTIGSLFEKLFGGSESGISEADFKRIADIVANAIRVRDDNVENADLKTYSTLLSEYVRNHDEATRETVQDQSLLVANQIDKLATVGRGFEGADAYLYAMGLHMAALSLGKDNEANLADRASDALTNLLVYEKQLASAIPIDQFAYFKLYTFGEVPYSTTECPALSYFGDNYREVMQRLLVIFARNNPTGYNDFFDPARQSAQDPHSPQLAIRFFSRDANHSAMPHIWTTTIHDDDHGHFTDWTAITVNGPLGDYYPLGDVGAITPRDDHISIKVPGVRSFSSQLPQATIGDSYWNDKGSGHSDNLFAWNLSAPDSYVTIGGKISGSSDRPAIGSPACIPTGLSFQQQTKTVIMSGGWKEDVSVFKHPQFGDYGLFILIRKKFVEGPQGNCIKLENLQGYMRFSSPAAPDFDAGNWVGTLPYGSSGRWRAGNKVRYRVSFYGPRGQSRPGYWWSPTMPGADASGYFNLDRYSCPTLTNITTDPAGEATGRIIYRQFQGRDEELVGVIPNNTDTRFTDTTDAPGYGPPLSGPDFDPGNWTTGVPVAGSSRWVNGYKVRYAVSFYSPAGATPMGRWWSPAHWPFSDADGYYAGSPYAKPSLTNIPTDPTGTATERIIYRQFQGGDVEIVGVIADNGTTTFVDGTENAIYTHPLTAPDFNTGEWKAGVGYGTSGRWASGYKVRYRVAFYNDAGTLPGPWWRPAYWHGADSEGYWHEDTWACPTLVNIPVDPTGQAKGRIIYRQFQGRDPEVVAVIADNTTTTFSDMADAPGYGPPASGPDFNTGEWKGTVPMQGSTKWVSGGYKVRYAVSFYNADGETPMGPWWRPAYWHGADSEGYWYEDNWACPTLVNIPVDSTNTASGRRIYRQFFGYSVERVGDIANNTDTTFVDMSL